ncbi:MAG: TIGR02679 family protein [Gammaproteobacteria bacterium]|nr:TIGR02679 family protein [Gammaproteobacteria bacterium]MCF6364418.1 TIGR02679 family protein [Gammaproteobacteria bacterium]
MTRAIDHARLKRIFDKPELARLLERLQNRFERGIAGPTLTLPNPTLGERKAIAALLGRPPGSGHSIRIAIADLEAVIQKGELAPDLRTVVASLCGPLRDLASKKAAEQQAWQAVFEGIEADVNPQAIETWLDKLRTDGLLKRLAKGDPQTATILLHQALSVIRQLPGQGQTLSTLAANTLGDAHALDTGCPVATLVKRALKQIELSASLNDKTEETNREQWASAGILVGGAITSTVLVLNLPATGDSLTGNIIHQARQHGQPLWLTLRQLVRDPSQWQVDGRTIYICENPAVVAEAADRLGTDCAPLVCTYGQPRAAVNHLLSQLQVAGAKLAYHGDFDWPGITIANGIMRRFGARPWHFDEAAYRQAVVKGKMALKGRPVTAQWDVGLSEAMKEKEIAIPEERLLEILLKSLHLAKESS